MKEHIQVLGRKRWHGDHFIDLQKESLDAMQEYLKTFGAFIISGCVTTVNAGTPTNFDISAGLVAINHADGFKIARFAGVTNTPTLGYLTIAKTSIAGNYATGTATIIENYTAVHNASTLPTYTSFHLPLVNVGQEPLSFTKAIRNYQYTNWVSFLVSTSKANGTIYMRVDKIAKRLHISAKSFLIKGMASWSSNIEPIELISWSALTSNAEIGSFVAAYANTLPLSNCCVDISGGMLEDASNKTTITNVQAIMDSGFGLTVFAIRSAGNVNYYIDINLSFELSV